MLKLIKYCMLMICVISYAQIDFQAVASESEIKTNQRVQISFIIRADNDADVGEISLPNFSGFQLLGINRGSNVVNINGKVTTHYIESVILFPKKAGTFTIGPASVKINKKKYESNPVQIKVEEDRDNKNDEERAYDSVLKMKLHLSKCEVYPNESIIGEVKLYAKSYDLLRRRSDIEEPSMSGFQVKKISENEQRNFSQEDIDGRIFVSEEIAKFQFTPTKTGDIEIPEFKIRLAIPLDIFEEKIVLLKTKPTVVHVKELPGNAPKSFTGAVGEFKMIESLEEKKYKVNKPIEYEIEIIGEGNLSSIQIPELELPNQLEVYPPKKRNSIVQTASGEKGKIVISYIIVPQYAGKYVIPKTEFSYFNSDLGVYETVKTKEHEINVENVIVDNDEPDEDIEKSDLEQDSLQIEKDTVSHKSSIKKFIKLPDLPELDKSSNDKFSVWYWLLLFPIVGVLIYLFLKQRKSKLPAQNKLNKNLGEIKTSLKNQLNELKISQRHNDVENFTKISSNILNDIVKLYSDNSEDILYTQSQASAILSNSVSEQFLKKWEKLFMANQLLRYSGSLTEEPLDKLYTQYEDLILESLKIY